MTLATIKVTVYFVGLVSFYDPRPRPLPNPIPPPTREVIVPSATGSASHDSVTLEKHVMTLMITGLAGSTPDTVCTDTLGGSWVASLSRCDVGLSGKWITLPVSTTAFKTLPVFNLVPKMTNRCPGVTLDPSYLTDKTKYAARLTLTTGTLSACTDKKGPNWVSRLVLDEATDEIMIGDTPGTGASATLVDGTEIFIINIPPGTPSTDHRAHFYWYYKMYTRPASEGVCRALPIHATDSYRCSVPIPGDVPAASGGSGCSNTDYP